MNQITKSVNPSSSSINIERFTKGLSSLEICDGLFNFYNYEFYSDEKWNKYSTLAFSIKNPYLSKFYEDNISKADFIQHLARTNKDSITIDFFVNKYSNNFEVNFSRLEIPEFVKKVELGKYYQGSGKISESIKIWEELVDTSILLIPVYETAVINLFSCYVLNKDYNRAITLHIDNYIINHFIVQKVKDIELRKIIRTNKFKGLKPSIDLPLFYTICEADENEIHIAYEKFLDSLEIEKPTEIDVLKVDISKDKLKLFLWLTCTTELFKHSIYINGSKDGLHERIGVCRQLQIIDHINADEYKNEIDSITNILIVQEGLQQLDESKIYVNEQGLINSELKEFEGLFNRYKTIARIFNQGKLLTFYVQSADDLAAKKDTRSNSIAKFSDHPLKDAFKELFDVIKDKFLHSKFGISAYLSTRIRHGVLLGELRPVFEKYHLISQFDKNEGKYRDVDYWKIKYNRVGVTNMTKLQDSIAELSKNVDKFIYDLIKTNLQIGLEQSDGSAWFDYHFDDIDLTLMSVNLKEVDNYPDFIKRVIEFLWSRTDANLEKIRCEIQGEVKHQFNKVISEFDSDLKSKNLSASVPEIFTNINTCSTDVQNSIEKIASWFNRSGSQTSDFPITKVINIVLEKINQSYPSKNLDYDIKVDNEVLIKGEFYSHIADLFRIFFDNALTHSLDDHDRIPLSIDILNNNSWLIIDIKNMYPDPVKISNMSALSEKVNIKKLSTEGKSGFHKASKIIKSDLKHDRNEYFREIDSEGRYCVNLKISLENLVV